MQNEARQQRGTTLVGILMLTVVAVIATALRIQV
jgi:Tfp pilus assembly protein PilX